MKPKIQSPKSSVAECCLADQASRITHHVSFLLAFTLIELLTVIAILGILAAIALPTVNAFKPNPMAAASRQLLDDLAYARHRAIADHTTVYVLFMPLATNLRDVNGMIRTNDYQKLIKGQYVSYALYEPREIGSQPGQATPHYITGWRTLPKGTAIAREKFNFKAGIAPATNAISQVDGGPFDYPTFNYTYAGPFRSDLTATNEASTNYFPSIAFDYRGSLASPWEAWRPPSPPYPVNTTSAGFDCIIPLTTAAVFPIGPANGPFTWSAGVTYNETPPGAWTNFNLHNNIVIDGPTGRARVDRQQIQ